jgi:hypothetical protein
MFTWLFYNAIINYCSYCRIIKNHELLETLEKAVVTCFNYYPSTGMWTFRWSRSTSQEILLIQHWRPCELLGGLPVICVKPSKEVTTAYSNSRRLVAGPWTRRTGFNPRPIHGGQKGTVSVSQPTKSPLFHHMIYQCKTEGDIGAWEGGNNRKGGENFVINSFMICPSRQPLLGCQIRHKMGGTYGKHGEEEKCFRGWWGNPNEMTIWRT